MFSVLSRSTGSDAAPYPVHLVLDWESYAQWGGLYSGLLARVSEVRCPQWTCHEAGVARRIAWVAGQAKQRNLKKLSSAGGFLPPGRLSSLSTLPRVCLPGPVTEHVPTLALDRVREHSKRMNMRLIKQLRVVQEELVEKPPSNQVCAIWSHSRDLPGASQN